MNPFAVFAGTLRCPVRETSSFRDRQSHGYRPVHGNASTDPRSFRVGWLLLQDLGISSPFLASFPVGDCLRIDFGTRQLTVPKQQYQTAHLHGLPDLTTISCAVCPNSQILKPPVVDASSLLRTVNQLGRLCGQHINFSELTVERCNQHLWQSSENRPEPTTFTSGA